jgi:serine palmitoyltransferase
MKAPTASSTRKMRLLRLLGVQSRFRKSMSPVLKEATENASTSSQTSATTDVTSDDDSFTASYDYYQSGTDPYADVRDRMEELSLRDRQRFIQGHATMDHGDGSIPSIVAYFVYLSYAVLIFMGHLRDFGALLLRRGRYVRRHTGGPADQVQWYAPLLKSWENFYTRRLYSRIQDVFNRPIASNPGAMITVLERVSDDDRKSMQLLGPLSNVDTPQQQREYEGGEHFTLSHDGSVARQCLNLGSYNYLGFGDDWGKTCATDVKGSLQPFPVSVSSCRNEYGTTALHRELECTVAKFLGKEDALVLNMGFNTNATTIPALVGPGDLILSDELNHTSIVNGARASGAAIRTFRHNDVTNLEAILREAVVLGRPRTRRPWNKILVIVEGIYSMEGEYCDLRRIVRICKLYGAYVYLDEAHSIGAMGPTGRGLSEFTGTDTADIDIMMGTFTKSFGGMGGYIASDKATIDYLRQRSSGSAFHNALSPVVCQQVLTCFKVCRYIYMGLGCTRNGLCTHVACLLLFTLQVICGEDGTNLGRSKLHALRDNSNYFRMRLREMGLQVLGQYDSPIMPVMLYHPGKISGFSRECFKRGLAVVVVGFPAVPLLMSRARICISAGHTREYLDRALKEIDEIADILHLRYQPKNPDLEQ